MMRYFQVDYWFYTSTILQLLHNQTYQPLLNGMLKVYDALLNWLYDFEPDNSTFPSDKESEHMQLLNQQKAKQSTYMDCFSAQCCQIFYLDDFVITSLIDLDRVACYLKFDYMEAIFSSDGKCTIYYFPPLSLFNEANTTCIIYN
ncbi:MAG: hypothetical protein RR356_02570 [Bacteroidales bacterium]